MISAATLSTLVAPRPERAFVLGIGVSAITIDEAVSTIEGWLERGERHYVCITGAHGVIESQRDAQLRDIHNKAGLVAPDGMPLVFMAHRLGFPAVTRVYGPELMKRLTERSRSTGYRQFYFGGGQGLADRLADRLQRQYPGLNVVGTWSPPFTAPTSEEDDAIVERINAARPDILWVGLSTPKQEVWMASHIGRLNVPVLIGVGAAFDFLAGTKHQAPLWLQRSGLEWLYRLCCEPRRLWRRYLKIVPTFAVLAMVQLATQRWRG